MIQILQCFGYQLECDICGAWETVHTGDSDPHFSNETVHDRRTAMRVCGFHDSNGEELDIPLDTMGIRSSVVKRCYYCNSQVRIREVKDNEDHS